MFGVSRSNLPNGVWESRREYTVKTLHQNNQRNLTDDPGRKAPLAVGGWKREEITRMGKPNELKKVVAGRHNCVVNGPEESGKCKPY